MASLAHPAATGTDTGGSIRQPAALCNLTGLKPTYGVVSRYGMIAFASSLDQAGPMARTAEDCGLMLNAMAGSTPKDSTSLERARKTICATSNKAAGRPEDRPAEGILRRRLRRRRDGLRAGRHRRIPKARRRNGGSLAAEHAARRRRLLRDRAGRGQLEPVALRRRALRLPRPGIRRPRRHVPEEPRQGFGAEVKRRILIGTYVLSHGYYDAYYLQAQRIRRLIANDFVEAFRQCDVILGPTSPCTAFGLGEKSADPVQMYLSDIYTIAVNLAGLPGMSIPCGFRPACRSVCS